MGGKYRRKRVDIFFHASDLGESLSFQRLNIHVLNHANPANPIGNIASPYFLKSTASSQAFLFGLGGGSGGNRQITFRVRLGF
jgi:hypothetical protein